MGYSCKILADSISPDGARLTTMELCYPRIIHSEFMTHRVFSRNAASSRAIPVAKQIERVLEEPFIPENWGLNQRGMSAAEEATLAQSTTCRLHWLIARDNAVRRAEALAEEGIHKQLVNRLLEPFSWITVICSGTEWGNFFHLRCHRDAQPEFQKIARMARDAYYASTPVDTPFGAWHLPLVTGEDERDVLNYINSHELVYTVEEALNLASVGKCARVSYLTHDGRRDVKEDIALASRLSNSGHWSPFEHVAKPMVTHMGKSWSGNFYGWQQYRKTFPGENRLVLEKDPAAYDR